MIAISPRTVLPHYTMIILPLSLSTNSYFLFLFVHVFFAVYYIVHHLCLIYLLPTFASYSSSLVFFSSLIACFHSWMIYSVRYVASRFFFSASCLYPNPRLNSVRVRAPLVLSNPSINSVRQENGITAGGTHKKQIYEIHKYKRCILVQCTCLVYRDTKIMRSCSTYIKLRAGIQFLPLRSGLRLHQPFCLGLACALLLIQCSGLNRGICQPSTR